MSRARTKQELLDFGQAEYDKLMALAKQYESEGKLELPIFDNRTVKDILAHLLAWDVLEFGWYDEGMAGKKPAIPAPGYTFKDAPALNEKLYQDYKDMPWAEVLAKLKTAHEKMLALVSKHTEEELFEKKKYAWTGTTSMGSYFASAISSHYAWANDLLRKKLKG